MIVEAFIVGICLLWAASSVASAIDRYTNTLRQINHLPSLEKEKEEQEKS